MTDVLRERPAAQRVLGALIVAVFSVGVAVAIARNGDDAITGAGRLDTDGTANVTRADGSAFRAAGPTTLHDGDVAEAVEGTMTLQLPDGATVEGRPASSRGEATKLRAGPVVEVLGGEALVTSPKTASVVVDDNHVTVQPPSGESSAARIGRSLAVTVGAYRGSVELDSAGQERTIPSLRQMEVAVLGRPPTDPKPLSLDHPDAWDLRYLGEAVELGATLQSLSNGYSPTLRPDEGRTASFYEALIPALSGVQGFGDALVRAAPTRPQGELLVGAAITALGRNGDTAHRWASTFAFRDAGASWGLVALDQGVSSAPLLEAVKGAIDHTTFEFAAAATPGPTAPATTPPPTTAPPSNQQDPGPTTAPTTRPSPTTDEPPTLPEPTVPTLPPLTLPPVTVPPAVGGDGGVLNTLVGAVGQLLGNLLGGGG